MKKNVYLVLPLAVMLITELIVRVCHGFGHHYFFTLYFSTSILLLLDVVFHNKRLKKTLINIVVLLTIVGGGFLSSYYSAFDTIVTFGHLGKAGDFSGVMVIIPEYINLDTFLFVLLLFTYLFVMSKVKVQGKVDKRKVIVLILTFILVLTTNYGILRLHVKQPIYERFGILFYVSYDLVHLKEETSLSLGEVDNYLESRLVEKKSNVMSGTFEGKNLIVVMVESLDDHVIDEYLPTLSQLKKTGFYFENYYIPRYQAVTADSEFIYNTSLIPLLKNGTTFKRYQDNTYKTSLASMFTEINYNTYYFHDYYGSFYNRNKAIRGLGFEHIYFAEDLGIKVDKGMVEMPNDVEMITSSLAKIDLDKPFYCFYTTISGHQKYDRPSTKEYASYYKTVVSDDYDDIFPYYLASIRQSDDAIKELILQLKDNQLLNETVIVITSDHLAKNAGNDFLKAKGTDPYLSYKGPLIIWSPELERKSIGTVASSFDLLPTLANLFSLDYSPASYVGKDIFAGGERFIPFYDKQWMTENGYYDAPSQNYYSFDGEEENLILNSERLSTVHDMGQAILKYDYYQTK